MTYFVTGATGFIGRHLVERLLQRDGDIYVLVREGSTERLDALIEQCDGRDRIKPVIGDLPAGAARRLVVRPEQLARRRRPLLPPRRDLRHHRRRDAEHAANVDGTRNAVELANALGAERFHHVSSIAAAGSYAACSARTCSTRASSSTTRTTRRSSSPSASRARRRGPVARLPPVDRGRPLQDRRDGQDRRALLLLQGDPEARGTPCPSGSRSSARARLPNMVPVDFVATSLDHIAHEPGLDGQAFHLSTRSRCARARR